MTNEQRQKSLDKKKWLMSEECEQDLSGEMIYCEFCGCSAHKNCTATQEEREKGCLCAKAFNRMKRR